MKHEKIIRLKCGGRAKIEVNHTSSFANSKPFQMRVEFCGKGKRTFNALHNGDDYIYRGLEMDEREKVRLKFAIELVGATAINQALEEFHEKMRPKFEDVYFN